MWKFPDLVWCAGGGCGPAAAAALDALPTRFSTRIAATPQVGGHQLGFTAEETATDTQAAGYRTLLPPPRGKPGTQTHRDVDDLPDLVLLKLHFLRPGKLCEEGW